MWSAPTRYNQEARRRVVTFSVDPPADCHRVGARGSARQLLHGFGTRSAAYSPRSSASSSRARLRVALPFLVRAHEARAAARGVDGVLEDFAVPLAARVLRLRAILAYPEHAQRGLAMVREIAVDADPAVAYRVEAAE